MPFHLSQQLADAGIGRNATREIIIGIDPGKSGGIAWLAPQPWATKMPDTEREIWDLLSAVREPAFAYIERVSAMPKQGVASTFKFGQHYGMLRAFLIAAKIPFEAVTPGVWQRKMGCLSKGKKAVTRAKAQELFPQLRVTNATADALLMAEYGRRMRNNEKMEADDAR